MTLHTNQVGLLTPLKEWRYRLPELTDDEDDQPVVTAVDVQEQLDNFRELTRRKIHEIRLETNSLEEWIGIWERACSESLGVDQSSFELHA